MYTRQQYLNRECTHSEYYGQFVTKEILGTIAYNFTKEVLKEAIEKNEHLNSIPLSKWDWLASYYFFKGQVAHKFKECNDSYSLAGGVCILKEAARQYAKN